VTQVKVTPHPMHYNDVCLAGTGCISQRGNRNLADFFAVTIDQSGAAAIVYDDTSNGLVQPGFTPDSIELVDHSGAPLVTVARQSSGTGLYGKPVSGPSNAPVSGIGDASGDALYPVIGGTNVPGMDIAGTSMKLSSRGNVLDVTTRVVDLTNPAATASQITGAHYLQFVTRWQLGNTIYYAAMSQTPGGSPSFCFPHVLTYPEPTVGGLSEPGAVTCPDSPSATSPCSVTIHVNVADVGGAGLLEEVGTYALATAHLQGVTTNAQALADDVPLEIDGACCYNFRPSK
jgi:hypothetical protein